MGRQRPGLAAGAVLVWLLVGYRRWVRPWMYRWGAGPDECVAALPGDDLVTPDAPRTTRAITIGAPPEHVWPWLAQIGEDRGGFYSYDLLERMVGADIHNADVIHPEWQRLRTGDRVWLARRYGERGSQLVAEVAPGAHLVLVSDDDYDRQARGLPAWGAWSFHLRPHRSGTRLLVRGSGGLVGHAGFDVAHFIMEQKMMRGIRRRAERLWRESSGEPRCGAPESLPAATATP